MNEQLLSYLFDDQSHLLAAPLGQWVGASPRFKAFAATYRDKIRKKIRVTQSDAAIQDLQVELETAYWLLQEKRFTVIYEPYGSEKRRGPDFAVSFKSITFNVEVTRINSRKMKRPLPGSEEVMMPEITMTGPDPSQVNGRLMDTVCEKLGQLRPGMANMLIVAMTGDFARALDLNQAMAQLKGRAERKEAGLFGRYGFASTAAFFKYYLCLSGVLVRPAAGQEELVPVALWINNQAKHALPGSIRTILQRG